MGDDIKQAKRRAKEADVRRLVGRLGLESARQSDKYECPVCPSSDALHVYEDGAYCYSGSHPDSDRQMDAIALVEAATGKGFVGALEFITGTPLSDGGGESSDGTDRPNEPFQNDDSDDESGDTDDGASEYFADLLAGLTLSERGAEYLEGRGISPDLARDVGIVDATQDEWRPLLRDLGREGLECCGLLNDDSPHPWYDRFLVIPFWDGNEVATVRFRRIGDGGGPKMASVTSPGPTHSPSPYLWGWYGATPDRLWVVEGELDALSLLELGECAVATYSASIWRECWDRVFAGFDEVIVVAEGDDAGDKLARRVTRSVWRQRGRGWVAANLRKRKIKGGDANDLKMAGCLQEFIDSV